MKPVVIFVGADKGGVGKTTVSRALLDYLASKNILTRAFDTEHPRGTLKRFHPAITDIVDVTSTPDQMRMLDTLSTSGQKVTIIDVRAGQLAASLRALRDIGFLEAVRNGEFTFLVFHILGPSIASLEEIAEIAPFVGDASYYLVKNFVNDTTFFEWDPQTYASYFRKVRHAGDIVIPKLNEMAYEQVEVAAVSFTNFVADKTSDGEPAGNSFVLRGYVRTWLRNIASEFDRVGLTSTIDGKSPATPPVTE
ncbi:MAG TPA: hypothetical protein VIL72_07415 [Beijerinckiaceae bacterium]|jgi:hypothetical protein